MAEAAPEAPLARGPGGEFSTVQHFFNTRHTEFAKLVDENPELTKMMENVFEATLRIVEDNGVNLRAIKFKPVVHMFRGRIQIDLGLRGL